jgi:hypothetical protein
MWFSSCYNKQEILSNSLSLSSVDVILIPKYRLELKKQKERHMTILQFEEEIYTLLKCFDKKITTTLFAFFTFYNRQVSEKKRVNMRCFKLTFPSCVLLLRSHITSMFNNIDDLYILIISEFLRR